MRQIPLRLSDDLNERSKAEAVRLGISLNALVSVALDAYLSRGGNCQAVPVEPPKPALEATERRSPSPTCSPAPVEAPRPAPALSRQQRRSLERAQLKRG